MVRPAAFGFNEETAVNNYFQTHPTISKKELQKIALLEFDTMVQALRSKGIHVVVIEDNMEPAKPDAIFPNNWLSTSPEGIYRSFPYTLPAEEQKREKISCSSLQINLSQRISRTGANTKWKEGFWKERGAW